MKTAAEFLTAGYTDLVSVIPPKGRLSPTSKIRPESRGKAPGVLYASGSWGGYDWINAETDAARIDRDGANIGLRAHSYPAVDVDVRDEALAALISGVVERFLPEAPMRVGQWPKRLFSYRLADGAEPFTRLQLYIDYNDERHLVEILGSGQQYLIGGLHPKTMAPYDWRRPLPASAKNLPTITKAQAEGLLEAIQTEVCEYLGLGYERAGTGNLVTRRETNQESLVAPDLDLLQTAVESIPNTAESFPARADFIRFGYALRGATQSDPGKGLDIFVDWAVRANHVANTPEGVQREWDTLHGPYELGADYIFDVARKYGFDMAVHEFPAEPAPVISPPTFVESTSRYSDVWLKDQVISRYGGRMRYVAKSGKWLAWDDAIWRDDVLCAVPQYVSRVCVEVANRLNVMGDGARERKENDSIARGIASSRQQDSILKLAKNDSRVIVQPDMLDTDPFLLGTPEGVIDLRTGAMLDAKPEWLITKSTSVPPMKGKSPLWTAYLNEATGGDEELQDYLQRVAGYMLTGSVKEQLLFFCYGQGGRGKGTFINALSKIYGSYAKVGNTDVFMSQKFRGHPTELADLAGARMVTAQESQEGRHWDEPRVKQLTGGDDVTARFMNQDQFTFKPTFKLMFSGNYRPHVQNLDVAMKRRIHLIPFDREPKEKNLDLPALLERSEFPAILQWAIEGAVAWNSGRLIHKDPPKLVMAATQEYFDDEDPIGRWIGERCVLGTGSARSGELYESYTAWCDGMGENIGTQKAFSVKLAGRGLRKSRGKDGHMQFEGISVLGEFAVAELV